MSDNNGNNAQNASSPIGGEDRIAIVLVTHGDSGTAMLEAAQKMCGRLDDVLVVGVAQGEARESVERRIDAAVDGLGARQVLFLVDLFGSTPFRLCCRACCGRSAVITGLNLAMLFKLATANRSSGVAALAAELAATGTKSIQVLGGPSS